MTVRRRTLAAWIAHNPWEALIVLLLVIWTVNQLAPLFWMLSMSLKTDMQILREPFTVPWPAYTENYPRAWLGINSQVTLNIYFRNTVTVVAAGLAILTAVATLAGYAFGRFDFPARRLLFMILMALIAVPMHALVIPLYRELRFFGLINNPIGLILLNVTAMLPFSVMMMQAYYSTFPQDLEDASLIDGCNRFGTFIRVAVPISKGAISAVAIVNFVGMWNEVLLALIVLWENEKRTMAVGILGYMAQYGETRWGLIFAGLTIVTIPLIAFYLIFQKNILKGATLRILPLMGTAGDGLMTGDSASDPGPDRSHFRGGSEPRE